MTISKASPSDAGCWIDGHWGQYATARLVEIAIAHGYPPADPVADIAQRKMFQLARADHLELTDSEEEFLFDSADDVERWMNEHVAPSGFFFGWQDGEFFLQSEAWWADEV